MIAGGFGGGFAGVITPPPPYMGIEGEFLCYAVDDSKGNLGVLCCGAAGPFFGVNATLGVQGAFGLCLTCETICDLEGPLDQLMTTGALKGGATGGGSASSGQEE